MSINPYSPATPENESERSERHPILFAIAFWLTATIAVLLAALAVFVAYYNFTMMREMGGRLPTYIPLVTTLMLVCSAALGYSASQWRKRKPGRALLSFLAAVVTVIAGPRTLLFLLHGSSG